MLVSSVHGDHQGDKRQGKPGAGKCKKLKYKVKATPNSNSVEIAAGTDAKVLGAGQMRLYLRVRLVTPVSIRRKPRRWLSVFARVAE
jgi:hypothetical protein